MSAMTPERTMTSRDAPGYRCEATPAAEAATSPPTNSARKRPLGTFESAQAKKPMSSPAAAAASISTSRPRRNTATAAEAVATATHSRARG